MLYWRGKLRVPLRSIFKAVSPLAYPLFPYGNQGVEIGAV